MNGVANSSTIRKPVIHHLHELQWRLTWAVLAIIAGSTLAYSVSTWLLAVIQKPLGQTLYYTAPMGGFNFLLKLCLAVGFVLALPVILYQVFAFLGPLLSGRNRLTIIKYTSWSFILACIGILFAYFISLPSALQFLSQFGGESIRSLITVDQYFNFALAYLVGFALMFQVPLVVLFINRIKPLKPSKMMRLQRYIILFSFIAAAMLTPTPDPFNQTIMALPAILLYQIGILLVWLINRPKNSVAVAVVPEDVEGYDDTLTGVPRQVPVSVVGVLATRITPQDTASATPRIARSTSRRSIDGFVIRGTDQQQLPQRPVTGDVFTSTKSLQSPQSPLQVKRYFDVMNPPARPLKT